MCVAKQKLRDETQNCEMRAGIVFRLHSASCWLYWCWGAYEVQHQWQRRRER